MLRLLLVHESPAVHLLIRQELDLAFSNLWLEVVMGEVALEQALRQGSFDLAILDAQLTWCDGIQVLQQIKHRYPGLPVLMLTDCQDVAVAVAAMKAGLTDYLVRSQTDRDRLIAAVHTALQSRADPEQWRSHATLEALIHAAPLAITVLDRWGIVQVWNPAAEEIFGWRASEALGCRMPTVPLEKQAEFQANIQITLQGEPLTGMETQRRRKDGSLIDVQIWTAVLCNARGEADSLMSIVADITERKQVEADRDRALAREQTARTQAEAASRLKDDFLAMLSHELRSPLNSVLGLAQVLQNRKCDEAMTQRALETIERNARAQTQLVKDLLDMSRIIQGKLNLNIRPVQLTTLIEAVLETVCPAATAKNIQLVSRLISLDPIAADGDRLRQVIWNLLANAIKFTPYGGRVEVELTLTEAARGCDQGGDAPVQDVNATATYARTAPNAQAVQLTVRDSGQGISSEFLPYVFDRFRQADSQSTRRHGGLGLGLAIVRHLVELHGGTVSVASPGEGQGSVFMVRLPVCRLISSPINYPVECSRPAP